MNDELQSLARQEAHHRFLNTLTALRGLLQQAFAPFADPGVQDAVATFEARIMAFAGVHRSLLANPRVQVIDVPAHFGDLCAQLAAAQLAPRGFHCQFFADEGCMDPTIGEQLGLIIAELITNAAKHAFPGRTWGRVSVALRRVDEAWTCIVQDNGSGLRAGVGGDGGRLVEALARGVRAELRTFSDASGVLVAVRLPREAAFHLGSDASPPTEGAHPDDRRWSERGAATTRSAPT
jgi:two-component sensor histidine kinase